MYQPLELFIGLRYFHGHTTDPFGRLVSWLSTFGIMLGVIALVIVLSVMNGFERELKNNILGLIPQAILSSSTGSIQSKNLLKDATKQFQGVYRVSPITTSEIVLQSAHSIMVGVMLGIDSDFPDVLTPYLINTKHADLIPGQFNLILGEQLARELNVHQGDQLRVLVPSVNISTPIGPIPNSRLFNVIGTFSTPHSEVDHYQVLINIQDASCLMQYPRGNITGWRLWLNEPMDVIKLCQKKLPKDITWYDWRDQKGELFQAVQMEKKIMGLLLSLIVAVSAFNIIISLGLMVIEKQNEVAILQTQGLIKRKIMIVFIVQGITTGIIGTVIGALLGVLFANYLNHLVSIFRISGNNVIFPVAIEPIQVITIMLAAMILSFLATLYPAWYATKTQPAEILRYE